MGAYEEAMKDSAAAKAKGYGGTVTTTIDKNTGKVTQALNNQSNGSSVNSGVVSAIPKATNATVTSSIPKQTSVTSGGGSNKTNNYNPAQQITNIYSDAKWDANLRTITAGGRQLREGVDFSINPADNKAYYISSPSAQGASQASGSAMPTATTPNNYPDYLRVTNIYSDAKWDPSTRTITAGGRTLIEGKDFTINPADNRAYYLSSGGAGVGDTNVLSGSATEGQTSPWWMENAPKDPLYAQDIPYQNETQDIFKQLQKAIQTPFSYDPATDPTYQKMVDTATQSVFESMNQRGILASTVTRDGVSQAIAPIIQQLMQFAYSRQQDNVSNLSNLLGKTSTLENQEYTRRADAEKMQYERQRQDYLDQLEEQKMALEAKESQIKSASEKVKLLGYADNEASVILGVPVGTPSFEAIKTAQDLEVKIQLAKMDNEASMQRAQLSSATSRANNADSIAASNWRTMYTQDQINNRDGDNIDPSEELIADKAALLDRLTSGELTRDLAIQQILNQRKVGLIEYDYANELLSTVDAISPAAGSSVATRNMRTRMPGR